MKEMEVAIAGLTQLVGSIRYCSVKQIGYKNRRGAGRRSAEAARGARAALDYGSPASHRPHQDPHERSGRGHVVVKERKGRRAADVLLRHLSDGKTKMAPSRKGVSIDAGKLGALINALRIAEQHLG